MTPLFNCGDDVPIVFKISYEISEKYEIPLQFIVLACCLNRLKQILDDIYNFIMIKKEIKNGSSKIINISSGTLPEDRIEISLKTFNGDEVEIIIKDHSLIKMDFSKFKDVVNAEYVTRNLFNRVHS